MPQVNYNNIPTYHRTQTKQSQDQNIGSQNQSNSTLLPFVKWAFIFFCPSIITALFKRFLEQIEIFCTYTAGIGTIIILAFLIICLVSHGKD